MAGGIATEHDKTRPDLAVTRTPVGPNGVEKTKTDGSAAVVDAVIVVGIAWAVLFFLVFSLRAHNI